MLQNSIQVGRAITYVNSLRAFGFKSTDAYIKLRAESFDGLQYNTAEIGGKLKGIILNCITDFELE